MTKGRRFFIFFSSAGIMTLFLIFTLSVREDKPLKKYMEWLPNNRVLSMILERTDAQNKVYPKHIEFLDSANQAIQTHNVTELEVIHALKDGDVEFSHDRTKPRINPKEYYILIEINGEEYYTLARVFTGRSEIFQFGKVD